MRKAVCITILLSALSMAAMSAGAESVGLAESGAQFRIQRQAEVIQGNPETGAVINQGDLIVSGDAPVRVRLSSGDSVLVGRQSSVSLLDASQIQLETGEMAAAYAPGSQMNLHYEDLNFVPLADEAKKKAEHRLALRANGPTEIYATGLNQPFAILSNQAEPVQVAMLGDADVLRLSRQELGKWNVLRMQSNPTASTGGQPSSAAGAGAEDDSKGCKCESEVTITDLQQGAAGAKVIKGMINCRKEDNKDEKQETPQLPSSYSLEVGSGSIRCGQKSEFPIKVYQAANLTSFKIKIPYNEWCIEFVSAANGEATANWKIESDNSKDGEVIITANMDKDGKPVNGNGEVLRIKFSCVKCCPCLSELIPADFKDGLAGAKPIKGQARCRKSTQDMEVAPISPPTELSVAVGHDETICGTDIKTTVTVYGAVNLTDFSMSVLYNDRCIGYLSVSDADATKKWDIKGKAEKAGTMVITGKKGEAGKPINGTGEIATIRFRCCPAAIIWWPWASLGAAGLIAGAGAGTAIVIENRGKHHEHKERRHPSSPVIPPE